MLHRLPYAEKRAPAEAPAPETSGARDARGGGARSPRASRRSARGDGEIPFGWDNEFPRACRSVPAFTIDALPVTNGEFLEFVEAGGYAGLVPLAAGRRRVARAARRLASAVLAEGGRRLVLGRAVRPRPVAGTRGPSGSAMPRRRPTRVGREGASRPRPSSTAPRSGRPTGRSGAFPWGDEPPAPAHGNFGGDRDDPVPAARGRRARAPGACRSWSGTDGSGRRRRSRGSTASRRWRRTRATPPTSSTAATSSSRARLRRRPPTLVRRTFRNWFQARYPYVYAKFRCVAP